MSHLHRLFSQQPSKLVSPLENFSTEVLALAIEHDPKPFLKALAKAEPWSPKEHGEGSPGSSSDQQATWPCSPACGRGEPRHDWSTVEVTKVETQKFLAGHDDVRSGFLDLAVTFRTENGSLHSAWVEVKVDASASGDQMEVYLKHRCKHDPHPVLVTLTRGERIHPVVTGLSWSDLADAMDEESHRWWHDLKAFLLVERVIVPSGTPDSDALRFLPMFARVNETIRLSWPNPAQFLYWPSLKKLETFVRKTLDRSKRLVATGGPLTYGLEPTENGCEWRISLGNGSKSAYPVRVEPGILIEAAESGGLPDTWVRTKIPHELFVRRMPRTSDQTEDQIVGWFDTALGELKASRVLDPYLAALRAKYPSPAPSQEASAGEEPRPDGADMVSDLAG